MSLSLSSLYLFNLGIALSMSSDDLAARETATHTYSLACTYLIWILLYLGRRNARLVASSSLSRNTPLVVVPRLIFRPIIYHDNSNHTIYALFYSRGAAVDRLTCKILGIVEKCIKESDLVHDSTL